ncbi:MAG: YetF domain-containing protein [Pseudomonadota bacterium]
MDFFDKLLEGAPLVIVEDGHLLWERMSKARVDEEDILTAARELQGLERMDQIKYAVRERGGGISVVPKRGPGGE